MTTNPQTLRSLGAYWTSQGGVNLGVVGNAAHTSGYHLGRDRIYDGSGPGQGDADYSVKLARDKAGLTNAASAIDLGKLNGSLANLRAFSRDLVKRCMASATTRRDVGEVICAPDGTKVQRYSGVDNLIHTGAGNGDASHITHTHISWFRDSEGRDKRPIFAPYFAPASGDAMPTLTAYVPGHVAIVKPTANVRIAPKLTAAVIRVVGTAETWAVIGWVKGDVDPESGSDQWVCRWATGRWEFTAKVNLTSEPTAPVTDCAPAIKAATDPLNAAISTLRTDLSAAPARERERIAQAEAARIRNI